MSPSSKRDQQKAVAEEFDSYRDTYADAVNDALSITGMNVDLFVRAKARHIVQEARSHFASDLSTLSTIDVGCGIGQYQALLRDDFARNVGIDVSKASVDRAGKDNPFAEYAHYDGDRIPFDDETFDVSFAVCVMHHVPVENWRSFVNEMHRVTKVGGLSLLLEHSTTHPLTRHIVNNCPFDADAVLVKRRIARNIFSEAGFKDVRTKSILTIPAVDGLLKSVDNALGVLPFGTQYCLSAVRS